MQRDFLGREKRMWVAGVPFFIKKSENPQGKDLERFLRSTVFLCESKRMGARAACDWHLPARVRARGTANLAQLFSVCPIFVPVPVLILFLRE